MNRKQLLSLTLLVAALGAGVIGAAAQTSDNPQQPAAALGASFTYQGYLTDDAGEPIHDSCDIRFQLFDAATSGNQVGISDLKSGVQVMNGYFTVTLNDNDEFGAQPFDGNERYLQITVNCPGIGEVTLNGRQPLRAAPYAIYALNIPAHDHWGETWSGTGTGLWLNSDGTGLYAKVTSVMGVGVYGVADPPAGAGSGTGVLGRSYSEEGAGVWGDAQAMSGENYGVHGASNSPEGFGIYGVNNDDSGYGTGVYGLSSSPFGYGVYGESEGTGVYGLSTSQNGTGIHGEGVYAGVEGEATTGAGLLGWGMDAGSIGVLGHSWGADGIGVQGTSSYIGVKGYSSNGVAILAAGGGVISSTADSEIFLSPFTAMRRDSYTDLTFTPLDNGGVRIKKVGTGTGERLVVLPVSTTGVLFGTPVYVNSLEICYKTSATAGYITASGAYKGNGETWASYLSSGTDHSSLTRECYTVEASTRALINNSSYVQVHLYFTNTTEPEITIFTVKVVVSEMPE